MPTYKEYFDKNRSKPKWFIGDRVFGHWNKIPFVGTVLNDNVVDDDQGPRVSVWLDLPLLYEKEYKTILVVKQKEIKKLTKF